MTTIYNIFNPLDQFQIIKFLTIDAPILFNAYISLTNIGVYLIISLIIIMTYHILSGIKDKFVTDNWLLTLEILYATVHSIVISQINDKKGQIYFPFIYSLFIFILVNNLVSLVPYNFAPTSHFILTFSLSFTIVFGATILGLYKHGIDFFSLFVPSGCPLALLPLLVIIEIISYISRNVSLGLRLGANILSGHMLLAILCGFTYNIMSSSLALFFFGLLPLACISAFSGLEIGIAFIQAQVFIVLSCSYIKDCLDLH